MILRYLRPLQASKRHFLISVLILCGCLLTSCTTTPTPSQSTGKTPTVAQTPESATLVPTAISVSSPVATHRAVQHYTQQVVLSGNSRPDDLVFDREGRLLFSDPHNGTINRLNADGSVTVILSGINAPEGLVVLSDDTLVLAEQGFNRILTLAPGARTPQILRRLPGTPSTAHCKDGVDGIAYDATTNTLIIPDSPIGEVYRLSLDGKTLTPLASGIVRPVGAAVDAQGNIYVADECGNALWKITRSGQKTRIGGFGMLDDVVIDTDGTILLSDLDPAIHALIRFDPITGARTILASKGYIEPQGIALDQQGDIFVSDDYADVIMKYIPS